MTNKIKWEERFKLTENTDLSYFTFWEGYRQYYDDNKKVLTNVTEELKRMMVFDMFKFDIKDYFKNNIKKIKLHSVYLELKKDVVFSITPSLFFLKGCLCKLSYEVNSKGILYCAYINFNKFAFRDCLNNAIIKIDGEYPYEHRFNISTDIPFKVINELIQEGYADLLVRL